VQRFGKTRELFIGGALGTFHVLEAVFDPVAVVFVGLLVTRHREDAAARRQLAVAEGLEQSRDQFAPGQVAGAAEKDKIE
jgi:hypothetical protein